MAGIVIIESVLFIALIAALVVLIFSAILHYTPLGVRLRQAANRRRIDRAAELRCPVHGPYDEGELVRLPSGERICPACYREAVRGELD